MTSGVLIEKLELSELIRIVRTAMSNETTPLRAEIEELRDELRRCYRVTTPSRATWFFDEDVTPETIIDYIKYRGLPAFKNGRKWFIYLDDLLDWQIGAIGWETAKEINIVSPRHHLQRHGRNRRIPASVADRIPSN